jgi:hypothetical protein
MNIFFMFLLNNHKNHFNNIIILPFKEKGISITLTILELD